MNNAVKSQKIKDNTHYFIYLACIIGLYIVNYFRVNGSGGQWAFANELIVPILFVMILVRIGIKDFIKVRTGIITFVFCVLFPLFFNNFSRGNDYDFQLIGRYVNVYICLILVLYLLEKVIKDNNTRHLFKRINAVGIIWVVFTLLCIVSRNTSFWPLWIFILFGCFYFIPIEDNEKETLIRAIIDGIIICFFVFQSLALLYCPYDIAGYIGFFSNSDCNAKFYTISYIGFLMKYSMLRRQEKKIRYIFLLFAGAMCGFTIFTIIRSAYIGITILTVAYLIAEEILYFKKGIKGLFARVLQIIIIIAISLPIIYVCIRYIPALRHHPIFNGIYSENRVHSWDPINSEKYISPEEFIQATLGGKISFSYSTTSVDFEDEDNYKSIETVYEEEHGLAFQGINKIKELAKDEERVIEYEDGILPGSDSSHPMFVKILYNNRFESILGIRKYIFKGYLIDSKIMGNKDEYPSYWITCERPYTSSHCSYIDVISKYGFIAGITYILFLLATILYSIVQIKSIKKTSDKDDVWPLFTLCVFTACAGWGVFYSVVFCGEILESMFWITALPVVTSAELRN